MTSYPTDRRVVFTDAARTPDGLRPPFRRIGICYDTTVLAGEAASSIRGCGFQA